MTVSSGTLPNHIGNCLFQVLGSHHSWESLATETQKKISKISLRRSRFLPRFESDDSMNLIQLSLGSNFSSEPAQLRTSTCVLIESYLFKYFLFSIKKISIGVFYLLELAWRSLPPDLALHFQIRTLALVFLIQKSHLTSLASTTTFQSFRAGVLNWDKNGQQSWLLMLTRIQFSWLEFFSN